MGSAPGLLHFAGVGFEPEGWIGGETWCPLRVGNYSKPRVLKEPEGLWVLVKRNPTPSADNISYRAIE